MKDFARLDIQRQQPLTLEEMMRIATRLQGIEAFLIYNWGGQRVFSDGGSSEEVTGLIATPTGEDSPSKEDASISLDRPDTDEAPPEVVYHEGYVEDETQVASTLIQLLPGHHAIMSSVQMIFGYNDCEEKKKNYYFTVRLYAKHDIEDPKSPVVVVAQHPYKTEFFCGTVELDAKMLTCAQEVLDELTFRGRLKGMRLKSELPYVGNTPRFKEELAMIRENYCKR